MTAGALPQATPLTGAPVFPTSFPAITGTLVHMSTTTLHKPRVTAVAVTALTVATLLSACSDDNKGESTGSVTAAPSATETTPVPLDTRCHTSQLTVTAGPADGAAGSVYRQIVFTNSSGADCTVSGYPGVSLVTGADGATQVGSAADRENSGGTNPVITLSPGQSATADLTITNPGVYGDRCSETPADALKIFPPDERDATVVAVNGLVGCTGADAPVTLRITALRS